MDRRVRIRRHRWPASALIAALSLLLYLPFFQNYQALNVGLGLDHLRTILADYWQLFGLFLFLVASCLVVEALQRPLSRWPGWPAAGRPGDGTQLPRCLAAAARAGRRLTAPRRTG